MGSSRRGILLSAIAAFSWVLGSSPMVAGAQRAIERERTSSVPAAPAIPRRIVSDADCTFLKNPSPFLERREVRDARRSSEMGRVITWTATADGVPVSPDTIRRNNFIDDEIFTRMASAGIRPAPLAPDVEFLRRVTLDLTGRIPSAGDVTSFLADTDTNKRNTKIDALIATPEFTDKWTMFFGDLFENNVVNTHVTRGFPGRDAFYLYLRQSIADNKPYDVLARELMTGSGNSYSVGPANWAVGNTISNGPEQDTYDGAAVDVASMFMGINVVECLLCHDGARHLDQINVWGTAQTRHNLWGLAAYFSRTTMVGAPGGGFTVADNGTGAYRLNTREGNRTPRLPIGTVDTVAPRYPFSNPGGGVSSGENYREALARQITADLQFSRAAVNYVWEKIMVEALVSPSNGFDLARLDPNNPPPAPWTLQPTNPQLLDRLARDFQNNGYNLRLLIATIVKSNAYQLSSTYIDEWKPSYVPYYARHYVRRLDAEEIHDAIVKATGRLGFYRILDSNLPTVNYAMQLPDSMEPRYDSLATAFLNTLGRGDRDGIARSSDSSIAQSLLLMNNRFVVDRLQFSPLPTETTPAGVIQRLFLSTLSRPPTDAEMQALLPTFDTGFTPPVPGGGLPPVFNLPPGVTLPGPVLPLPPPSPVDPTPARHLQWALLNRLQFLFNY